MYAFYVIDLFFALLALFAALLATCFRLAGYLAAAVSALGLLCMSFSAAIMTFVFPQSLPRFAPLETNRGEVGDVTSSDRELSEMMGSLRGLVLRYSYSSNLLASTR